MTISIDGIPAVSLPADRPLPGDGHSPDATTRQPHFVAPIHWEGQLAGEIRIMGDVSEAAQARVAAEAQLVGLLLETESDLASMTDQLIETQDQLLAVYDLGQLARQPMRLAERLLSLARAAGRLLNVEGTAVVLASDGRGPVAAQHPPAAQDEAWLVTLLSSLPSARGSLLEKAVLWQGDARPSSLPEQVNSLLMIPMGSGGQAQGVFVFWSERHERFASPDTKLARAIAQHAGVQIENALLQRDQIEQVRLETEMQLARQVQTGLLPKTLPRLPGLDVYACMRPASHVGGDFFDFVANPTGNTMFLVSDVSGKGMSAALVMTMTRTILRSVIGQAQKASGAGNLPRPAALLALVNDELFQDLRELSMFATAFVAQYYPPSRRLVYANAGHSPVIFKPAGLPARLLQADSPPIGVMPTLRHVEQTLTLGLGDLLVAASDGFNETRNAADEMLGLERLLRCVEESANQSAQAVGQTLFAIVEAFRDGQMQEDDQTLVIAKGV